MEDNIKQKGYKVYCTIPTLILSVLIYSLLMFGTGMSIGFLINQKSVYIAHYHAEDYGNMPTNFDNELKEDVKKEVKQNLKN